jgi:hypothetical protein
MSHSPGAIVALLLATLALADAAPAQRGGGGRGRPEAIKNRVGSFFVTGKVGNGDGDAATPFSGVDRIRQAAAEKIPAVLYLYDPQDDPRKHEQFERTVFNNDELGVSLRPFRCVRVDVTNWPEGRTKYGKQLPLFVSFDQGGKVAGEAAMPGYKAAVSPILAVLGKAAAGFVKPNLAAFVDNYKEVVQDLERVENKKKALQDRKSRLSRKDKDDPAKAAELQKEEKEIAADEQRLLAKEKEILDLAKVHARDANAQQLGERQDGR